MLSLKLLFLKTVCRIKINIKIAGDLLNGIKYNLKQDKIPSNATD